ncbi:MAG: RNase H family protein [Mariniblastus sp.]
MSQTAPHYLLFTEAKNHSIDQNLGGYWRFVLERIGTPDRTQESDEEPGIWGERLQLLAAVRGLESLDHPARITMVTRSKYVGRGIRRQLTQWRQNDWHWERFGQMALIKNHDLWQRIDHAMQIHQINCRVWQFDPPHVVHADSQNSDSHHADSLQASDQQTHSQKESMVAPCVAKPLEPKGPIACPPVESKRIVIPRSQRLPDSIESNEQPKKRRRRRVKQQNNSTRRMDLGRSTSAIENTLDQASRVSDLLADKIKPMGMGRAYGYAVN